MGSVIRGLLGRYQQYFVKSPDAKKPPGTGVADRKDFPWLIVGGTLMSFSAGWVNAFTIISTGFGVTHVTGTATKIGINMARQKTELLGYGFGLWCVL